MEWAVEAGDEVMVAWCLFRRAQQATAAGNAAQAIGLARAVQRYDSVLTPQMRAAALQQEAHGFALQQDETACHRLIDTALAHAAAPEVSGDARSGHGDFATPPYIEGQRAHCWTVLGRPDRAAAILVDAVRDLPQVYQRDRGLAHARLANAYALTQDFDRAAAHAASALETARSSGSTRTLRETIRAVDSMQPARSSPAAAELIAKVGEA